ncbi:hypothetical protein QIU19_14040 [Capnocytophaga canimorsus]|nr:hypothetical protein [Capnocytophaga canimorsus]WGU69548.1 hypothetical protein QIU19_14040 [Capnocytophaga canimorsus]
MIEILNFTLADFIDILLVALLLYYVYKLSRGTVAINIFWGDCYHLFDLEDY